MTDVVLSLLAGVGFGAFQTIHRRAQIGIDLYRGTFILIFGSAIVLTIVSLLTEDLSVLFNAPLISVMHFIISGFVHFFFGWTVLGISQNTIGAARTGAVVGSVPLFAAILAFFLLGEALSAGAIVGIVLVMGGVYVISAQRQAPEEGSSEPAKLVFPWWALAVALAWAVSPIFIRLGLRGLPSPLLGVTVSMYANVIGFGILLLVQRSKWKNQPIHSHGFRWEIAAAIFISLATWVRWIAIDLAEIAVVLALGRVNVPMVMILSPIIIGGAKEKVTVMLWIGAALIIAGSLILTFV